MHFYASKSFADNGPQAPPGGRRIVYGWALVPPQSTQTLARVTTYHPSLKRLLFNPLPELAALRTTPALFQAPAGAAIALAPGSSRWLGDWAPGAGNASDVLATVRIPPSGSGVVVVTVGVLVGPPSAAGGQNVSTNITISIDTDRLTANVTAGGSQLSNYMPGIDLPGGDYNVTVSSAVMLPESWITHAETLWS